MLCFRLSCVHFNLKFWTLCIATGVSHLARLSALATNQLYCFFYTFHTQYNLCKHAIEKEALLMYSATRSCILEQLSFRVRRLWKITVAVIASSHSPPAKSLGLNQFQKTHHFNAELIRRKAIVLSRRRQAYSQRHPRHRDDRGNPSSWRILRAPFVDMS